MRLILAVIAAILGLLVLIGVNGHNLQLLAAGLIAAAIATVAP